MESFDGLMAEWTAYLSKASSFHNMVDTLRQFVKPNKEVLLRDIHDSLRWRLGEQQYSELMDACGGMNRYIELAAKHMKITKSLSEDSILFHDAALPYFRHCDNGPTLPFRLASCHTLKLLFLTRSTHTVSYQASPQNRTSSSATLVPSPQLKASVC